MRSDGAARSTTPSRTLALRQHGAPLFIVAIAVLVALIGMIVVVAAHRGTGTFEVGALMVGSGTGTLAALATALGTAALLRRMHRD